MLRTEMYREMERLLAVGCAFVIPVMTFRRLTRRKFAAATATFREDNQLTARQFGFQRLAVSGPSDVIVFFETTAFYVPRLTFVHDRRPRIRYFYWERQNLKFTRI